jgi:2-oxoglutarate dehydrogenase E1 component
MGPGTYFQRLIIEGSRGDNMLAKSKKQGIKFADPMHIENIIFCTGKIFYHLYHYRTAKLTKDNDSTQSSKILIARLEQIAPFPYDLISPFVERYPNAKLIWVQEEPKNMGAWGYIKPRFDTLLKDIEAISGHKRVIKY